MSKILHGMFLCQILGIVYLKFKLNWSSCVLFAEPGDTIWRTIVSRCPYPNSNGWQRHGSEDLSQGQSWCCAEWVVTSMAFSSESRPGLGAGGQWTTAQLSALRKRSFHSILPSCFYSFRRIFSVVPSPSCYMGQWRMQKWTACPLLTFLGLEWWYIPVIPALGKQRQEDSILRPAWATRETQSQKNQKDFLDPWRHICMEDGEPIRDSGIFTIKRQPAQWILLCLG
jgi:hypothetical protein